MLTPIVSAWASDAVAFVRTCKVHSSGGILITGASSGIGQGVGTMEGFPVVNVLGPPVVPFLTPFWGRVPLLKKATEQKRAPLF